jgi:hypothetical protein
LSHIIEGETKNTGGESHFHSHPQGKIPLGNFHPYQYSSNTTNTRTHFKMRNKDSVTIVNQSTLGFGGPRRYNNNRGGGLDFRKIFQSTLSTKGRRPSTIEEEESTDDEDVVDENETKAERIMRSISNDGDDSCYKKVPMNSELLAATRYTKRHTITDVDTASVPNSSLQSCLDLLSSSDLDQNRVGLQRLMLLTKGRALSGMYRSEELASFALVYGGELGSIEDRLQYVFSTMICDAPHGDTHMLDQGAFNLDDSDDCDDDDISTCPDMDNETQDENELVEEDVGDLMDGIEDNGSWDDYSSDEEDSGEEGKSWGALHNHALRVLTSALTQVVNSSSVESTSIVPIPLHDTIWRNIVQSLVKNIVNHSNADTTGYSLKIVRMVFSIHPELTLPLLRHTLFPHLVYLHHYGESHRFPMIHTEASYLLKQATQFSTM